MPLSDLQIQTLARDAVQRATAGDFAGAEPLLAQMAEARPNSGQALNLLGQARLKLGRFAEAREPLERAAKFLPKEAAAQVNLAGCLSVLGEHEPALAALERAALLKPGDAAIAHNRGRALEALGRAEEAERAYDEALSIDHRLMPSLSARASLLAGARRLDGRARRSRHGADHTAQRCAFAPAPRRAAAAPGRLAARPCRPRGAPGDRGRALRARPAALAGRAADRPAADLSRAGRYRERCRDARHADAGARRRRRRCSAAPRLADWLDLPTIGRGEPLDGFAAAAPLAQPAASPGLDARSPCRRPPRHGSRPNPRRASAGSRAAEPPAGLAVERDPGQIAQCRLVVGDDTRADASRRAAGHSDGPAAGPLPPTGCGVR